LVIFNLHLQNVDRLNPTIGTLREALFWIMSRAPENGSVASSFYFVACQFEKRRRSWHAAGIALRVVGLI